MQGPRKLIQTVRLVAVASFHGSTIEHAYLQVHVENPSILNSHFPHFL